MPRQRNPLDAFNRQYDLGLEEGVALRCLAKALLHIPDQKAAKTP